VALQLGHYAPIWRHIFAIFVSRAAEHCDLLLALSDARILCDDPHATGIDFGLVKDFVFAVDATALGLNVGFEPRLARMLQCK
jgi:hypothetical protein